MDVRLAFEQVAAMYREGGLGAESVVLVLLDAGRRGAQLEVLHGTSEFSRHLLLSASGDWCRRFPVEKQQAGRFSVLNG